MINERVQGCIADTLTTLPDSFQTIQTIQNNCQAANYLYVKPI